MPAPALPDASGVAPSSNPEAAASGQTTGTSSFGSVLAEIATKAPAAKATDQSGPAQQTMRDAKPGGNTAPQAALPGTGPSEPASPIATPGQLIWKQIAAQTESQKRATDVAEPQTAAQAEPAAKTLHASAAIATAKTAGPAQRTRLNPAGTADAQGAERSQGPATAESNKSTDTADATPVLPVVIPAPAAATEATATGGGNISPAELQQQKFVASLASGDAPAPDARTSQAGNAGNPIPSSVRGKHKDTADPQSKTEASSSPEAPAPVAAPVVTIPAFRPAMTSTSSGADRGKGQTVSSAPVDQDQKVSGAPHAAVEVRIRMNGQHGALNTSLLNPSFLDGSSLNGTGQNAAGLDASASHTRFVKGAPATVSSASVPSSAVPAPNALAPEAAVKAPRGSAASVSPNLAAPGAQAGATRHTNGERVSAEHAADQNSKQTSHDPDDDSDAASENNSNTKAAAYHAGEHSTSAPVGSHAASVPDATAVTASHGAGSNVPVPAVAHAPVQTTQTAPPAKADAQPAPASPARAEDLADAGKPQQQPLRSMSLEFTPDGARDVRVRLSERGGDVHISLHSTDAALSGRLRDGVQDLAGALNHAGYNADAWASGRGDRQQQQQQRDADQQQRQRRSPNDADNDFSGMMRQTNQEAL